jgi:hypothetical protein
MKITYHEKRNLFYGDDTRAELVNAEEIADRIYKRLQRQGIPQQDSGELQAEDRLR